MNVTYKKSDESEKTYFGCFQEMPNETYHSLKSYLSRSAIMDYDRCPYTYWAKHLNPNRPKKDATAAMQLGSAFHTLILEPHLFYSQYATAPQKVLLKDVGREIYDFFKKECDELESSGKIVFSKEDWHNLMSMRRKIKSNEHAMQLIRDSRIENSFFWQDSHSEMLLKARPDILHSNMIVDLKTCSDASPRAYQAEMVKYGYHVQGAMIRDAVEAIEGNRINTVINICVETKYPYNMGIYIIDEFALDEGQAKYKSILLDIKNAISHNIFSDYGVQTISLPKWAI